MNPRIYIETERLRLRMLQPDDTRPMQLAISMSLPELAKWMPRAIKGQTQKQTRDYIYTQMALFVQDENYVFGMFGKESGVFYGMVELSPRIPRIPSFEIGFWLRSDLTSKGYMREAVAAVAGHSFEKMKARRVFLRCEPENVASVKVAEGCGFVREAWLKNDAIAVDNVTPVDTLVYGHVPETWERVKDSL